MASMQFTLDENELKLAVIEYIQTHYGATAKNVNIGVHKGDRNDPDYYTAVAICDQKPRQRQRQKSMDRD